jgi:hypothetical protein
VLIFIFLDSKQERKDAGVKGKMSFGSKEWKETLSSSQGTCYAIRYDRHSSDLAKA